ncbi:YiiX/YebB-like N1pC/P60 family cysteine hydrolase [Aliikangiella sp. IMCC44359]|uniref:YiiX/YebB-like N1pC/P60 family cysteine hydrolase n=1 Tax=Aliikangiella sp. IMCC44359 TaxID=3459125 RepID=UPI00403B31D7
MSEYSKPYFNEFPLSGDIALTSSDNKRSSIIRKAEKIFRGKETEYSHAMISIQGNIWCHAVTSGVQILTFCEALEDKLKKNQCKILRFKGAEHNALSNSKNWLEAMMFYAEQNYNYGYFLPKSKYDRSSFCSELVVKIYEKAAPNLKLGLNSSERVTPADLEELLDTERCEDVTHIYKTHYEEEYSNHNESKTNDEKWKSRLLQNRELYKFLGDWDLERAKSNVKRSKLLRNIYEKLNSHYPLSLSRLKDHERILIESRDVLWEHTREIDKALILVRNEIKKFQS